MRLNTIIRIQYEGLRSLAFGDIKDTYEAVGDPLSNPAILIKIYNGTDVDLLISQDGVTDNDILPSSATFTLDVNANKTSTGGLYFPRDQTFFVKHNVGDAPTTGSIYLTTLHIG